MHLWLGLSSLALTLLGSAVMIQLLHHLGSWKSRRLIQVMVLLVPLLSLAGGISGLHHFSGRPCLVNAPSWDSSLEVVVPVGMGLLALGAFACGLLRLALMTWLVKRKSIPASHDLQRYVEVLARGLGVPPVRVVLTATDRPIACVSGIFRPTVLLSTWILSHLDQRELEAVLAHEMEHVAQWDYVLNWVALILRDAFFYFPSSRLAYHQLQQEKELACDELVVRATRRPLALASALTKVWLHAVEMPGWPRWGLAQPLAEPRAPLQRRIERLLSTPASGVTTSAVPVLQAASRGTLEVRLLLLLLIVAIEIINVTAMLTLMGCGPAVLLPKLL